MKPTSPAPESIPEIAKRLRAVRMALGLSQAEISRRIGAQPTQWGNWEKARARIRVDEAMALKKRFGIPTDWIYLGDDRSMPYDLMRAIEAQEAISEKAAG